MMPAEGSIKVIQPITTVRLGRKNDSHSRNSMVGFMGMSVRPMVHASRIAIGQLMALVAR